MEHPEKEPLLSKDEKYYQTLDVKDFDNKNKSTEQIKDKTCPNDWLEIIFICCYNYDISKKQYELYLTLKEKVSIPFNTEEQEHEKLLQEFFSNVNELIGEEKECEITTNSSLNNNEKNNLISSLSKKIGFQTDNPRTDFRAGGLYSLEFMNFFVQNYKNESKEIFENKKFSNFGLICISLSYKLSLVLYLARKETIELSLKANNITACTRKQIKNFYENISNSEEKEKILFLILSQLLCFVYKKYEKDYNVNSGYENNFKINSIINTSLECFKEVLEYLKMNENLISKLGNRLDKAKFENINYKEEIKLN